MQCLALCKTCFYILWTEELHCCLFCSVTGCAIYRFIITVCKVEVFTGTGICYTLDTLHSIQFIHWLDSTFFPIFLYYCSFLYLQVVLWKRYSDFKHLFEAAFTLHKALHRLDPFPEFARPRLFGEFIVCFLKAALSEACVFWGLAIFQ